MDTQTSETWRSVKSLDGLIEVSSLGRARRIARPLVYSDGRSGMLKAGILRGAVSAAGYAFVTLGPKKLLLHRLVCEAFTDGDREANAYETVNHINGNKLDNRPENLEWATYKRNSQHARDTNLNKQHGTNCNLAKHSDQFINAVRNVYKAYNPTYAELGRLFGLRDGHVGQIIKMQTRRKPSD